MTHVKTALSILIAIATATSASAGTPTLSVGGCSGSDGERICVPVTLSGQGESIASAGFTLEYDTAAMRLPGGAADVVAGGALNGHSLAARVTEDPNLSERGRVQVVVSAPARLPIATLGDGKVCEVCFTVPAGSPQGCQAPRLAAVDLGSDTGKDVSVRAISQGPPSSGGCEIAVTIDSIHCRLSAVTQALESRADLGSLQGRVVNALERAKARSSKAKAYLDKGNTKLAARVLAQVVREVKRIEGMIDSRSGKKQLAPATRAIVVGMVDPIGIDAAALLGSL